MENGFLINTSTEMSLVTAPDMANTGGYVGVGSARRGEYWSMPEVYGTYRVHVGKGHGLYGNELSPFNLLVPAMLGIHDMGGSVPFELWWQAAKVAAGERSDEWMARRLSIYQTGIPKRRYLLKDTTIAGSAYPGDNIGEFDFCDYPRSRYYYCKAYTLTVWSTVAFQTLLATVRAHRNLFIVGPDGYNMNNVANWEERLSCAYASLDRPFGHELVLFTLLACAGAGLGPSAYPWEKLTPTRPYVGRIAHSPYPV